MRTLINSVETFSDILQCFQRFKQIIENILNKYNIIESLRKSAEEYQSRSNATRTIIEQLQSFQDFASFTSTIVEHLRSADKRLRTVKKYKDIVLSTRAIVDQLQSLKQEKEQFIQNADVQMCNCCNGRGYTLKSN